MPQVRFFVEGTLTFKCQMLLTSFQIFCRTPLQSRRLNGSLNRVPPNFYDSVWKILERTQGGIVIGGQQLPQVTSCSFEVQFCSSVKLELTVWQHV